MAKKKKKKGKKKASRRQKRGSKNTVNIENNYGNVIVTDSGKVYVTPVERPVNLDRTDDVFVTDKTSGAMSEPNPPGPNSMDPCDTFGNSCKASVEVHSLWVSQPQVKFDKDGYIMFNNAAIRAYGLQPDMAIMVCMTPKWDAVRFVLGREVFPNANAVNKYGYYRMKMNSCSIKGHVPKKDPRTGELWPNPKWLLSTIGRGSTTMQRFFREFPDFRNCTAPLFVDKRFGVKKGRKKVGSDVLYCREHEIASIPKDLSDKMYAGYKDRVTGRLAWEADDQIGQN